MTAQQSRSIRSHHQRCDLEPPGPSLTHQDHIRRNQDPDKNTARGQKVPFRTARAGKESEPVVVGLLRDPHHQPSTGTHDPTRKNSLNVPSNSQNTLVLEQKLRTVQTVKQPSGRFHGGNPRFPRTRGAQLLTRALTLLGSSPGSQEQVQPVLGSSPGSQHRLELLQLLHRPRPGPGLLNALPGPLTATVD